VMGAVAIGSVVTPAVVAAVGPRAAFVVAGGVLPVLVLLSWRGLAAIDHAAVARPELAVVDRVQIFAPLSVAAKEHLAARLVAVRVASGEVVIRSGDVGDRFYVVDEGELDVEAGGTHSRSGPGDFFGEVALLRDVRRTATVRATEPSRLYALDRDDFLVAVTGHSAVNSASHAVADERLSRGAYVARVPQER
jgi:Cyclic nucleotide-binding domain